MNIIEVVKESWGWVGLDPLEVVTQNAFGNLILKDNDDNFWRLCPEEVYCKVIASSVDEYNDMVQDTAFNEDWFMAAIVKEAEVHFDSLAQDHVYQLDTPAVLGGDYKLSNIKISSLDSSIKFSGHLGKLIKDLPEGAKIVVPPRNWA
jgi:hypothetical protein